MTKTEFVNALKEVIINNSNLEAEEDDTIMFDGVKSVDVTEGNIQVTFDNSDVVKISVV